MGKGTSISVHHVTRVEGHGNIVVDLRDGTLQRCELQIVESPRFFEALLKDRPHDEAPRITCRICGICSVGHATASIQAVEAALGIVPGPKTRTLRRLNMCGEWLQSHVLHAYFLVAPDLFQAPSVIPLASSHPEIVKRALRLKALANEICYAIGGRHVMPISYLPGTMGHWPPPATLETLRARLLAARPDVEATVELFATIEWPAFEQEIEALAALEEDGSYPMMGGPIHSSRGPVFAPGAYREASAEHLVEHSAAKHTRGANGPVRVGALARYQLAHERLGPAAKKAAAALKLSPAELQPLPHHAGAGGRVGPGLGGGDRALRAAARRPRARGARAGHTAARRGRGGAGGGSARNADPRLRGRVGRADRARQLRDPDRPEPGRDRGRHAGLRARPGQQAKRADHPPDGDAGAGLRPLHLVRRAPARRELRRRRAPRRRPAEPTPPPPTDHDGGGRW